MAAQLMETVEGEFEDDAYIRTVSIVYEVDSGSATHINVSSSDDRPWVQTEFMQQGLDAIECRVAMMQEDDD